MSESAGRPSTEPAGEQAPHRFCHRAMACVFEVLVADRPEQAARDAAEAAFQELDRLEKLLSCFHAYSDVARINAAPVCEAVVVELEVEACLLAARRAWRETDGAFDVTAGKPQPRGAGGAPDAGSPRVDMGLLEIDADRHTVRRLHEAVRVDLGGIGKGYALDRLAELLREWGVERALLHGGSSTAVALGGPPGQDGWRVWLRDPADEDAEPLGWVVLNRCAVSGSGTVHARHVTDPRTGRAVPGDRAAWAIAPLAAEADATTTALCVMEMDEVERYCEKHRARSCIVARRQGEAWRLRSFGPPVLAACGA